MRDRVLVIAPHPDDETLGCGGTLMRLRQQGSELTWLIVTGISEDSGWSAERVRERDAEIARVAELIGFSEIVNLRLPTAQLDTMPMRELIDKFSEAFQSVKPHQVFLPCRPGCTYRSPGDVRRRRSLHQMVPQPLSAPGACI